MSSNLQLEKCRIVGSADEPAKIVKVLTHRPLCLLGIPFFSDAARDFPAKQGMKKSTTFSILCEYLFLRDFFIFLNFIWASLVEKVLF
jgi:hypothetical protein